MQARHLDRKRYFEEQALTTEKHVIPFLSPYLKVTSDKRILEIGCGEGGNMQPFLDRGCKVVGIDLNAKQLENAAHYFEDHPHRSNLELICRNIYDIDPEKLGKFDLIMMRDVVEHIPNQEIFMGFVKPLLKDTGVFFLGFPPWYMPFGGHQQVLKGRISKLPWIHLLPRPVYTSLLRQTGQSEGAVQSMLEHVDTGISIERFRRIIKKHNYKVICERIWLINPHYEAKFKLKPRKQVDLLKAIPWVRDLTSTCAYYVLSK